MAPNIENAKSGQIFIKDLLCQGRHQDVERGSFYQIYQIFTQFKDFFLVADFHGQFQFKDFSQKGALVVCDKLC
jgi:hypothetical protein